MNLFTKLFGIAGNSEKKEESYKSTYINKPKPTAYKKVPRMNSEAAEMMSNYKSEIKSLKNQVKQLEEEKLLNTNIVPVRNEYKTDEALLEKSNKEALKITEELKNLQKEYVSIRSLYEKVGDEMADIKKQIDRLKISLSACQKVYKDEYVMPLAPEVPAIKETEDFDNVETTPPPLIIPKPLTIVGYSNIYDVIDKNFSSFIYNKDNSSRYIAKYSTYDHVIPMLGDLIQNCGKEVLLVRCKPIKEEVFNENDSIIKTCKKICELRTSGDKQGLEKYLSYFIGKYPLPKNPFEEEKPVDFIQDEYNSIFNNAFFLLCFFNKYYKIFENKQQRLIFHPRFRYTEFNKVEINEGLVKLMEMLNELQYNGYKICIVPILDENILYRPKSAAQDGEVFSLLYYDKYVEIPEMEEIEKKEPLYSSYSSSSSFSYGSSYVSGHYRSGYMRNGKWVSGGYVKGHYRK